jgi:Peptidase family C25
VIRLLQILFLFFVSNSSSAQIFGNEWIDYSQKYYKFKIHQEGIYRIDRNTLLQALGVQLGSLDPRSIQIFGREKEVPILIVGESDGIFNVEDYIEFYANKNDGWIDQKLYGDSVPSLHPHYSLVNDTICYYLTWNTSISNLRMEIETDFNFGEYAAINWVWKKNSVGFNTSYYGGDLDPSGGSDSFYSKAEGWMGNRIGAGGFLDANVPTRNSYQQIDAPNWILKTVSAGVSNPGTYPNPNHGLQIFEGTDFINPLLDRAFFGYLVNRDSFSIAPNKLGIINTLIRHKVSSLYSSADNQAVSFVEIKYAHTLNFENENKFKCFVPFNSSESKSFLEISNFNQNATIYNLTKGSKINFELDETLLKVLIPNSSDQAENEIYIVNNSSIMYVSELKPIGLQGALTNFNLFSSLDSAFVIISENSLISGAEAYKNYRQLRFNTVLVNIDELYHQFGGGIEKHGLAIRRFCDFAIYNWNSPPQNLFIIGKGIREPDDFFSPGIRNSPTSFSSCLVPSLGYPSSDVFLTERLNGTNLEMAIPTGRLAAKNSNQVIDYLQKVQSFEGQLQAEWMKNILHFGGGTSIGEQTIFKNYLSKYETIIEDTNFAGSVSTFLKTSSEPIQLNYAEEISNKIDEGVSIMNFFGHALGDGFDISIDDPENFDWNGKYPLVLGNSCYNGDIFKPGALSESEQFVLLPNKGAIAFLASSKLGYPGFLDIYAEGLYKNISSLNYGGSIGSQMVNAIKNFQLTAPNNPFSVAACQQNTLHGDPSLVINSFPKPDLFISSSSIFFEPTDISALTDTISVNVVITNLGKSTNSLFNVTIEHSLPNEQKLVYTLPVNGILFKDTVSVKIPLDFLTSAGIHKFDVLVDLPENLIEELAGFESINNTVYDKELVVSSGGLIPIYPYNYSIVGTPNIALKASTANPFAASKNYILQIDTTDSYNSPLFLEQTINQSGGVVEWSVPQNLIDSSVYFWRVVEVPTDGEYKWREFSFQYIFGQSGWGQANFNQHKESKFNQVIYNTTESTFDFLTGNIPLAVNVYGNQASIFTEVTLNYEVVDYAGCQFIPSIHVMVFDPVTIEPWGTKYTNIDGTVQNPNNNFGNANNENSCRSRSSNYFIFRQTPDNLDDFNNFLSGNTIPDGHYILMYSWLYLARDNFGDLTHTTFANYGANQLANPAGIDSVPFIFFAKKGFPETAIEILGNNITDTLFFDTNILASGNKGFVTSPKFGPTTKWKSFYWEATNGDEIFTDSISIQIIGIKQNGVHENINSSYTLPVGEQLNLENIVDASIYPNLKLQAFFKDTINENPLQLRRWQLLSDNIPEAALNPADAFFFESNKLQEGQNIKLAIAIENISPVNMDSLLVSYWIQDSQNQKHFLSTARQDSLRTGEVLIDTVSFSTFGYKGENSLWIDVNPLNVTTNLYDQLEAYHFNNVAKINFEVTSDNINPILDVTFDGKHILDGEIVSAKPDIFISLKDENPYLILNETADTSNFKLFVADPKAVQKRVFFSDVNNLQYTPASSTNNKFKINYKPTFTMDGKYSLLVQATDKSGNNSGNYDYKINFEIINKSTITQVMNYPNPFTTRTQFVFTLTGSIIPDEFKIQILTVSGIVVKEITKQELGQLRIGNNITDYYWDGTDQFGDRLGNGVYFYRVITRIAGDKIKGRETEADNYFTKEFGKMYLMR